MITISSSCAPREQLIPMLQLLEDNNFNDVGIEIFYDAMPFYDADAIVKLLSKQVDKGLVSFHYPMEGVRLMEDDVNGWQYQYSIARFEESLKLAKQCHAKEMVFHASLFGRTTPLEERADMRRRWIERYPEWSALAQQYGVSLLVENSGIPSHDDELFSQEQFCELADVFPDMTFLLDIGHGHDTNWNQVALIEKLGTKITAYHLHNNDGHEDNHWPLRDKRGTLEFMPILEAAKKHTPNAAMIIEYGRWTFNDLQYIIDEICWLQDTLYSI